MKLAFSESQPDYDHYIFPYAVWAFPERGETPADFFLVISLGRRRSAMPECAAEREDDGGKSRRRPCDHEPSSHYEWLGKGVPFVLSKPLNGSAT